MCERERFKVENLADAFGRQRSVLFTDTNDLKRKSAFDHFSGEKSAVVAVSKLC